MGLWVSREAKDIDLGRGLVRSVVVYTVAYFWLILFYILAARDINEHQDGEQTKVPKNREGALSLLVMGLISIIPVGMTTWVMWSISPLSVSLTRFANFLTAVIEMLAFALSFPFLFLRGAPNNYTGWVVFYDVMFVLSLVTLAAVCGSIAAILTAYEQKSIGGGRQRFNPVNGQMDTRGYELAASNHTPMDNDRLNLWNSFPSDDDDVLYETDSDSLA